MFWLHLDMPENQKQALWQSLQQYDLRSSLPVKRLDRLDTYFGLLQRLLSVKRQQTLDAPGPRLQTASEPISLPALITTPLSAADLAALHSLVVEPVYYIFQENVQAKDAIQYAQEGATGVFQSTLALYLRLDRDRTLDETLCTHPSLLHALTTLFDHELPGTSTAWNELLEHINVLLDADFCALIQEGQVTASAWSGWMMQAELEELRVETCPLPRGPFPRLVVGRVKGGGPQPLSAPLVLLCARFLGQQLHRVRLLGQIVTAKREWEATADAIPDPLVLIDAQGKVLRSNRAFATLTGRPLKALTGTPIEELLHQSLLQLQGAPGSELMGTRGEVLELAPSRRFLRHWLPLEFERGVGLLYLRDITEERRLLSLVMDQQRYAAFGELSELLFHDLGQPASALRMELYNLRQELDSLREHIQAEGEQSSLAASLESFQSSLDDAEQCGQRISQLVVTLQQYRRLGQEPGEAQQPVHINHLLNMLPGLYSGLARRQRVKLELELAQIPTVQGRAQELMRVFENLLKNAFDAQPKGGRVLIQTRLVGEWVEVVVQDEGPGVSREILPHLFERGISTRWKEGGSGLGLYLCQQLVTRHHGTLRLESSYRRGAQFVVSLPATPSELLHEHSEGLES